MILLSHCVSDRIADQPLHDRQTVDHRFVRNHLHLFRRNLSDADPERGRRSVVDERPRRRNPLPLPQHAGRVLAAAPAHRVRRFRVQRRATLAAAAGNSEQTTSRDD